MKPIIDKRDFSGISANDLKETQRQITLRLKKLDGGNSENVKKLAEELKYWTKIILYEKAKYLFVTQLQAKIKFQKIRDALDQ
jgi:hypothetical protein